LDVLGQARAATRAEMASLDEHMQKNFLLRVQVTEIDYWEQKTSALKNIIMTRFPRLFPSSPTISDQAG